MEFIDPLRILRVGTPGNQSGTGGRIEGAKGSPGGLMLHFITPGSEDAEPELPAMFHLGTVQGLCELRDGHLVRINPDEETLLRLDAVRESSRADITVVTVQMGAGNHESGHPLPLIVIVHFQDGDQPFAFFVEMENGFLREFSPTGHHVRVGNILLTTRQQPQLPHDHPFSKTGIVAIIALLGPHLVPQGLVTSRNKFPAGTS